MARSRGSSLGSGDICPLVPEHGQMFVLNGSTTQYCPHQSHDGRSKRHPLGEAPATRKLWPVQFLGDAVKAYTAIHDSAAAAALPDIDLGGLL